jgi:hypothetical protein
MDRILPQHAKRFSSATALYRHLEKHHGISAAVASERLHQIKYRLGYGAADNVIFGYTGCIYDPITFEWIGSLTEGGPG